MWRRLGSLLAVWLAACGTPRSSAPAWQLEERQEYPSLGDQFILLDFRVLLVRGEHVGWLNEVVLRRHDDTQRWSRMVQGPDPRFTQLSSLRLFFIGAHEDSRRCWSDATSERITVAASGSIVGPTTMRMTALVRYARNWDVWKQEVETTLGDGDIHLLEGPETPKGRLVFFFRPEIVDTRQVPRK